MPQNTPKKKEPVALSAAIVALVAAVGPVLMAFGLEITDEQNAAVMGLVTAVVAVATGLYARSKVTAPERDPKPPITSETQA
ncbi:hypothetical protein [Nesterenkonia jeotgali]|uniref:Uncharacterized protein n=1 Tax=Nesterenkonia jeotgali TaxID=317018 RepID=A0A839FR94_9MICC|nr:hypothetical protein [Nesterenkonia jeotgali]MBA8920453.1 hypothetical protein [Nesterenkonia jeotgali]